ncbi:MAG: ABC transporter permease, partial [Ruminococcus sp.]
VTGTKRWYYTDAEYRVNGYDNDWIYGFAKEDVSALEENLIAGTVDYDELVSQNGIILINHTAENLSLSAQLGNVVEIDFLTKSGQTITNHYTIMGVSNFSHPAFNMFCYVSRAYE